MHTIRLPERMTSKERVRRVFEHREPDRVPINYAANPGIDRKLKAHFGLAPDDHEGLLQVLGVDFRGVGAAYSGPRLHEPVEGRYVCPLWGVRSRWVEYGESGYMDYCDFPLKDADVATIDAWPMPSPEDYDYASVVELCERYKDYAIYIGGPGIGDFINFSGRLRGMEEVLIGLITREPAQLRLMDRKLEIDLEVTRRTLEAAQGKVDLLWIGEDLGTQIGPMISRELFLEQILPRHQKLIELGNSFGVPVMLHSCGSSSWAFRDFIKTGLRAVEALQPEAKEMEPGYLKEHFGADLVFHGCISTGGSVAFGTVDEVISTVQKTLEVMMPGGGYCFAPAHSLQDNSPVENVVAMYEAAHRYGRYR